MSINIKTDPLRSAMNLPKIPTVPAVFAVSKMLSQLFSVYIGGILNDRRKSKISDADRF